MEKFDVNKIIEQYNIDAQDLAKWLFPNVKYPKLAFDRVLKGETNLDIVQVAILAKYVGVTVADLFANESWRSSFRDNLIVLTKGDYSVEFDPKCTFIRVYKNGEFVDNVLVNLQQSSFEEFINYIDNIIKRY